MEHRFRTHFSVPLAVASRPPIAVFAAQSEESSGPARVRGGEPVVSAGQGGAPQEKAWRISRPVAVRAKKTTFLECSMSGLISAGDNGPVRLLEALLKKSCVRSFFCCFVDRRFTRPRQEILDSLSAPSSQVDCRSGDAKDPGERSPKTIVARVYSSPTELSRACLLRATTPLEPRGLMQTRKKSNAAATGNHTSSTGNEMCVNVQDSGMCNAPGSEPATGGHRPEEWEDRTAYRRHKSSTASIWRSMDVVLADESAASASAINFLQLLDVTEYQTECWKGRVFEFRTSGGSPLPHSVSICSVYSDISGTREAFPGCAQVYIAARLPVDPDNRSKLTEVQHFLTTRLQQLGQALRPYVALRARHYMTVATAAGFAATC